ncbi:MAG: hypothetical protein QOE07_1967 [Acidimicrobiaceae bacterium]|jgi:hypothetical protein|nr:hypothetical protein [Acidimicrobiaceae bacterium]
MASENDWFAECTMLGKSPCVQDVADRVAEDQDLRLGGEGNFPNVEEVSADKGYSSRSNATAIEKHGAMPLIPFKSNTVEPPEGSAWARTYHQFDYNRDDFLTPLPPPLQRRTVFAMVKSKFGDGLLSKTTEAQTNEVLCEFVAHNLCVLIQAFYELDIESAFDGASAPGQRLALKG